MRGLRKFMGWVFGIFSLICTWGAVWVILHTIRTQRLYVFSDPRILPLDAILPSIAAVLGVAWWKVWKEKPSARGWGIGASLAFLPLPLWFIVRYSDPVGGAYGLQLAIGSVGLIAFLRRSKVKQEAPNSQPDSNPP
jgi:hypothetical protein